MIEDRDISIVIQGPILEEVINDQKIEITKNVCLNIKKFFPNAEIIISTWQGSNVEGLIYNKIILNEDPGSIFMSLNGIKRMNNTNRMIISTLNGLRNASRKYVMKLRSDMYFEKNDIIEKFETYKKIPQNQNKVLKARIVTLSANNYKRGEKRIFTLNDWFMFGYKEDLIKIWDISLQDYNNLYYEKETAEFENNLVGEDYVWTSFLKKDREYKEILKLEKYKISITKKNIYYSEKALAEYTILFTGKELGLNSYKYYNKNYVRRDFARLSCYTHSEWLKLQNKYFLIKEKIKFKDLDFLDKLIYFIVFKLLQKKVYFLYNILKNFYKICDKK